MKKLAIASAAAVAVLSGGLSAGIIGSKHDMEATNSGSWDNDGNSATRGVCVYCHTPHKVQGTGGPLWNRNYTNGVFTTYGTTLAGTTAATKPNSHSLACLSCHDGTTAIDSIYNVPGSGTWTSNNKTMPSAYYAYVGTDLSDDHPISITYTAGTAGLKTVASNNFVGGMRIYDSKVECPSCHAVHDDTNAAFLRVANTQSAVCTACHDR
jgi:predicted CXXCH cytochrome family protein